MIVQFAPIKNCDMEILLSLTNTCIRKPSLRLK